jgi:endonuclease-3
VTKKIEVEKVLSFLKSTYPEAHCELNFRNPFELLCATILSAQCTDARVNSVTPALFKSYPDFLSLSLAKQKDVEKIVRSTGFYKNKAHNLIKMAQKVISHHNGELPTDLEKLVQLPGVGRKTANVVCGNAFHLATGVVVDTHVKRLVQRWGWTKEVSPEKIELKLIRWVPKEDWIMFSHWAIWHGRRLCKARNPACHQCGLEKLCPKARSKV